MPNPRPSKTPALAVACPTCRATPGEFCKQPTGLPRAAHLNRIWKFQKSQAAEERKAAADAYSVSRIETKTDNDKKGTAENER